MSLCYYNKRLHKLLQGFARQVEKRHLHLPGIKNRYFSRLEGGLPVTNDAINSITAKSQEDYYNKVRSSEEDGQVPMKDRLSFKRLLMKAEDLRKAVIEATNFNSALDKIDGR
jgi:hypothetical protein